MLRVEVNVNSDRLKAMSGFIKTLHSEAVSPLVFGNAQHRITMPIIVQLSIADGAAMFRKIEQVKKPRVSPAKDHPR